MNGYHKQNGRARPIQLRLSLAVAITKALIDSDNSNDIGKNIDNKKIINIGHRRMHSGSDGFYMGMHILELVETTLRSNKDSRDHCNRLWAAPWSAFVCSPLAARIHFSRCIWVGLRRSWGSHCASIRWERCFVKYLSAFDRTNT